MHIHAYQESFTDTLFILKLLPKTALNETYNNKTACYFIAEVSINRHDVCCVYINAS